MLQRAGLIAAKDLRAELRGRELVNTTLVFTLVVLVLVRMATGGIGEVPERVAGAALWLALFFAGSIGLGRSMAAERDRGTLDGLLLGPVDRAAVYLGKLASNLAVMGMVAAAAVVIVAVLYEFPGAVELLSLVPIIALGLWGFAAAGTAISALAVQTQSRELMVPVLLFPLLVPVLWSAISGTSEVLYGGGLASALAEILLLIVYGICVTLASTVMFGYVMED